MTTVIIIAVAIIGFISTCDGHYYGRRTYMPPRPRMTYLPPRTLMPTVHHRVYYKRPIVLPATTRTYYHRLPTYVLPRTTVYPTRGHGPFYVPNFPGNINTIHPSAALTPALVVPAEGGVNPSDVTVSVTPDRSVIGRDIIDPSIIDLENAILPGLGNNIITPGGGISFRTPNVDAEGKPVVQVQGKDDQSGTVSDKGSSTSPSDITPDNSENLPPITPVVTPDSPDQSKGVVDTGIPDNSLPGSGTSTDNVEITFPDVLLPGTNVNPDEEGQKQNSSCHKDGCGTGAQCVFAEEYICPGYIPSVPCECRLGCRVDYTFIPLGGSITIDVCGNTCSCNNVYGAAECTQRMCKPDEPSISVAGAVSTDADIRGFQGAFQGISEFPTNPDMKIQPPTKALDGATFPVVSNGITVPELQQTIDVEPSVQKIGTETPQVPSSESITANTDATTNSVPDASKSESISQNSPTEKPVVSLSDDTL